MEDKSHLEQSRQEEQIREALNTHWHASAPTACWDLAPVIQSILRHAKPSTTALYMHRVNAAQMAAQSKFLDAIKVTSAAV